VAITKEYHNYYDGTWHTGAHATDVTKDLLVILPDGYSAANTYPWVMMQHSSSGSAHTFDADPASDVNAGAAQWFLDRGYIVVGSMTGNATNWGNDAACANVLLSRTYAMATYPLEAKPILMGFSMGGLATLTLAADNPTLWHAVMGFYPVTSLDAMHTPDAGNTSYNTAINTAYACNDAGYDAATAGHRPEDRYADLAASGLRFKFWHGATDTAVNHNSTEALRDGVNAIRAGAVEYVETSAGHGAFVVYTDFATNVQAFLDSVHGHAHSPMVVMPNSTVAKDTSLHDSAKDANYGTATSLYCGNARTGLLAIPDSYLALIPAGSIIDTVSVDLWETTRGSATSMSMYRVLVAWVQGTGSNPAAAGEPTWNHRVHDTVDWATPPCKGAGTDRVATASATDATFDATVNHRHTFTGAGLVADVQGWFDGTFVNNGWAIDANFGTVSFSSSDLLSNPQYRPYVTIGFTPPAAVAAHGSAPSLLAIGLV
jgi:hypothetical protein